MLNTRSNSSSVKPKSSILVFADANNSSYVGGASSAAMIAHTSASSSSVGRGSGPRHSAIECGGTELVSV